MGAVWETAVIVVVVGVAAVWAIRSARRAVTRKKVCSSCGSAGDCPLADGETPLQDFPVTGTCAHPPGTERADEDLTEIRS